MKQKLLLFFILVSTYVFGQENYYVELKSPLNISKCQKCIESNPVLDIKVINEIENFSNTYLELSKNNFIPIEFIVDREGIVITSKMDENVVFTKDLSIDPSKINELFRLSEGKKILYFNNGVQNVATKFTLSFFYDANTQNLILNPLTHK
jgi:hypothetical protein